MFAWIDAEKAEFPITKLCQYLQVSPSGFYAARGRPESARTQTDLRLRVLVRASFDESHQRYGSPRIHEDLIEQGERVSRKRVIRLMQEDGLEARARKRFTCTTMSDHESAGRRESLGPLLRGPRSEPALGRRHDGVRHRQQRQALSGRGPRLVLAVRRGLGRERRQ